MANNSSHIAACEWNSSNIQYVQNITESVELRLELVRGEADTAQELESRRIEIDV